MDRKCRWLSVDMPFYLSAWLGSRRRIYQMLQFNSWARFSSW